MYSIAILALDGVLDSALAISVDLFSAANRLARAAGRAAPFSVRVLGVGRKTVRTGSGYTRALDGVATARLRADAILVPGFDAPVPDELAAVLASPGARAAAAFLRRQHECGALLCASCTATFLLGEAGLLTGDATTSWYLSAYFRKRFPKVSLREDAMVVQSERVVTAGAALSQVDLVLFLLRRFAGPVLAERCARFLVVEERPTQARYLMMDHLRAESDEVRRAEAFMRAHLGERLRLSDVARAARASPRTLARRFEAALGLSPLRFLRRLRAEKAVHLLSTTALPFDDVAARVGYADPVALRRILRRELGTSAREVRRG